MTCMKCGAAVEEGQVFCDNCLTPMEQEPIHINTPVKLPVQPPKRAAARRIVTNPEEEVKRLEKFNQNLMLILVLLFTTVMLLTLIVFNQSGWQFMDNLGRNYSVAETTSLPTGE